MCIFVYTLLFGAVLVLTDMMKIVSHASLGTGKQVSKNNRRIIYNGLRWSYGLRWW